MIRVKEVTNKYTGDYEGRINRIIRDLEKDGWKLIDIKHSVTAYGVSANSNVKLFSALLIFDDSPTADIPTTLNQ